MFLLCFSGSEWFYVLEPHGSDMTGQTGDVPRMEMMSGVLGRKSLHPHISSKLEKGVVHTSFAGTGLGLPRRLDNVRSNRCLLVLFKDEMRRGR